MKAERGAVKRTAVTAAAATAALAAVLLSAGCASGPPPADWQLNAHGALQRAVEAQLSGVPRVAEAEYAQARAELARTGRSDLMARAELLRCAAEAASLQFGPCPGFERLRVDAAPAEQAYADHLLGEAAAGKRGLLPAAQQALATAPDGTPADVARLQAVADPLSRLVGAARWLRDGRASPAVMALAVDTASAQGWRRPLLAWLQAQRLEAESAGHVEAAARLARRIQLVLAGSALPTP